MCHEIDVGDVSPEAVLSISRNLSGFFDLSRDKRFFFLTKQKKDCSKIVIELVILPESLRTRVLS